jgi:hypothetical protein
MLERIKPSSWLSSLRAIPAGLIHLQSLQGTEPPRGIVNLSYLEESLDG